MLEFFEFNLEADSRGSFRLEFSMQANETIPPSELAKDVAARTAASATTMSGDYLIGL